MLARWARCTAALGSRGGGICRIMKRLLICLGLCWACGTEPRPARRVNLSSAPDSTGMERVAASTSEPAAGRSSEELGGELELAAPPLGPIAAAAAPDAGAAR